MPKHFDDFAAAGSVTPEDILALRRSVWSNGQIEIGEAEAILTMNASLRQSSAEWTDFFVEALSVWLVDQQDPRGYVDEAQVDWLIARLDRTDGVQSMAELELLVHVLEKAVSAPERLRRFAMVSIERAVIEGTGQTRDGGTLEPGRVTAGETRLLRRLVFASGGDRPAGVSGDEAELLFRIKDACRDGDNAPEWKQLFVQGVGNFLQASSIGEPLSRERELELERFVASRDSGLGGFIGRMAQVNARDVVATARDALRGSEAPVGRDWEAECARAVAIDADEQDWLDRKIGADGITDPYEQALLDFLKST